MNENEMNNLPPEKEPITTEETTNQIPYINQEPASHSPELDDDKEPQEGFTFKWINLLFGAAIFFYLTQNGFLSDDWTFYIYLSVVVIIHELGHVIAGKSFGCYIQEMQVFFLPFISYKSKQHSEGHSWQSIKWSLGTLPLGGVTVFKSRKSDKGNTMDGMDMGRWGVESSKSPYIEEKPAWQRLIISAAGVLFNIATFLILYFASPYMSLEMGNFFWPLALFSLLLAILNILPIYPLDGGSIVFALYEILTGKKPSQKFTNICGWIGFIIIILFFWVFPEWLGRLLTIVLNGIF